MPKTIVQFFLKFLGILAIPFIIAFAVQFVNEKETWVQNGQFEVQLPGDLFLYFSLIMLNFSWAFACIYYRLVIWFSIILMRLSFATSNTETP